jgi:hypothetical protein
MREPAGAELEFGSPRPSLLLLAPVLLILVLAGVNLLVEVIPLIGEVRWARIAPPLVLGALDLLAVPLLLAGRRVGWVLAVTLTGWHLFFRLLQVWTGDDAYLGLALGAMAAFLLNSREMRAAYREREATGR